MRAWKKALFKTGQNSTEQNTTRQNNTEHYKTEQYKTFQVFICADWQIAHHNTKQDRT